MRGSRIREQIEQLKELAALEEKNRQPPSVLTLAVGEEPNAEMQQLIEMNEAAGVTTVLLPRKGSFTTEMIEELFINTKESQNGE